MPSSIRRSQVDQATASGQLAHIHADGGVGGPPPNRPFVGGISTGLHYQPQSGDGIVVLGEDALVGNFPAATVSAAPPGSILPTMAGGETAIFGADGRVISYVKSDGTTTLWSKSGKPSTTVDANGNVTVGGNLNGQNIANGPATLDGTGKVSVAQWTGIRQRIRCVQNNNVTSATLVSTTWASYPGTFSPALQITTTGGAIGVRIHVNYAVPGASNQFMAFRAHINSVIYVLGESTCLAADRTYQGGETLTPALTAGTYTVTLDYQSRTGGGVQLAPVSFPDQEGFTVIIEEVF